MRNLQLRVTRGYLPAWIVLPVDSRGSLLLLDLDTPVEKRPLGGNTAAG